MPLLRPNDFSHSLFVVLRVFAHWEQPAVLPAAGLENGCHTRSQSPRPLPALRFAGAQKGSITLEYYGKEDFEILCGMLNSLKENHRGN